MISTFLLPQLLRCLYVKILLRFLLNWFLLIFRRWRHSQICVNLLILHIRNDINLPSNAVRVFVNLLSHDALAMRKVMILFIFWLSNSLNQFFVKMHADTSISPFLEISYNLVSWQCCTVYEAIEIKMSVFVPWLLESFIHDGDDLILIFDDLIDTHNHWHKIPRASLVSPRA